VTAWTFQTGDLEFSFTSPVAVDAPAYVKTLQNIQGFTNVSVERVGGDKALKVKLKVAKP
jgi:hypothetical protein